MNRFLLAFAACLLIAPAMARGANAPATQPSAAEIDRLIVDLGDPDSAVRDQATARLKQIGKPALPAVQKAAQGDDPEVRTRAAYLVRRIQQRGLPGGPIRLDGDAPIVARNFRIHRQGEASVMDATIDGRKVHIEKSAAGIRMTVTGLENGREVTETYEAKTPQDLREQSPEAHALAERWGGLGQGFVIRDAVQLQGALAQDDDDAFDALAERLAREMRKAALGDAQRRDVLNRIDRLRNMRQDELRPADPDAYAKKLQEYFKACDEFRKALADLKLPDPADEILPPPARARLGIAVRPSDIGPAVDGLVVQQVTPDSRAAKLGLRNGDIIQKLNGKPVATVQQLRQTLIATDKPLILEGLRDNQPLKLNEK